MEAPLLLGTIVHLFIGNVFRALLEALLIAGIFKLKFVRTLLLLLIGNYAGSWITFSLIPLLAARFANNFNFIPGMFWLLIGVLFIVPVLIEWPFIFAAFPPAKNRTYKTFAVSLVAQTCSCLMLALPYAQLVQSSLLTHCIFNQNISFSKNKNADVYFIGDTDDFLYRSRLDGSKPVPILSIAPHTTRLGICIDQGQPLLCAVANDPAGTLKPILRVLQSPCIQLSQYSASFTDWFATVSDQGSAASTMPWEPAKLTIHTPIVFISSMRFSVLPKDQVILEMVQREPAPGVPLLTTATTSSNIALYDLNSKQIASIGRGKCPIVIFDAKTEPIEATKNRQSGIDLSARINQPN